jgi:tetraacyldisaccharide-1-P 4'-kinase
VLELETTHTSLAAMRDKLNSKSKALDFQVIRSGEAVLRRKNAESRLEVAEEDLKNQKQMLESAQKTASKLEDSFNMMISSTVAHAAALFKNHLPDLNMELLRQDFTVDHAECKTSHLHMILLVLPSPMTTTAPRLCNLFLLHAG